MRSIKVTPLLIMVGILSCVFVSKGWTAETQPLNQNSQQPVVYETPPAKVETPQAKEETSSKLKDVQQRQQKVREDYEQKRKDLQAKLQQTLTNYKDEDGKPNRSDLIKQNNEEQEELRKWFQEETRKLQAEERKIRLGRETLQRPDMIQNANPVPTAPVNEEDARDQRMDLRQKIQEQNRLLEQDRIREEQEEQANRPQPVPTPKPEANKASGIPVGDTAPTEKPQENSEMSY
jgi:hypothetical protein